MRIELASLCCAMIAFSTFAIESPTITGVVALSDTSAQITWKNNSIDAKGFLILRRAEDSTSFAFVDSAAMIQRSYSDFSLRPGTNYYYGIIVFSETEISDTSNVDSVQTYPSVFAPPKLLSVIWFPSARMVQVTFRDSTNNESGFRIMRSTNHEPMTAVGAVKSDNPRLMEEHVWNDTGLTGNQWCFYQVEVVEGQKTLRSNIDTLYTFDPPVSEKYVKIEKVTTLDISCSGWTAMAGDTIIVTGDEFPAESSWVVSYIDVKDPDSPKVVKNGLMNQTSANKYPLSTLIPVYAFTHYNPIKIDYRKFGEKPFLVWNDSLFFYITYSSGYGLLSMVKYTRNDFTIIDTAFCGGSILGAQSDSSFFTVNSGYNLGLWKCHFEQNEITSAQYNVWPYGGDHGSVPPFGIVGYCDSNLYTQDGSYCISNLAHGLSFRYVSEPMKNVLKKYNTGFLYQIVASRFLASLNKYTNLFVNGLGLYAFDIRNQDNLLYLLDKELYYKDTFAISPGSGLISTIHDVFVDSAKCRIFVVETDKLRVYKYSFVNKTDASIKEPRSLHPMAYTNTLTNFPNPFSKTTTIRFSNPHKNAEVQIFNSAGKMVQNFRAVRDEWVIWSANGLPNGVYVVSCKVEKYITQKKIILQR